MKNASPSSLRIRMGEQEHFPRHFEGFACKLEKSASVGIPTQLHRCRSVVQWSSKVGLEAVAFLQPPKHPTVRDTQPPRALDNPERTRAGESGSPESYL